MSKQELLAEIQRLPVLEQRVLFDQLREILGGAENGVHGAETEGGPEIVTLAPERLELIAPIPVIIRPVDDSYVATFFDAGISMSGETQEEAFTNLRSLIIDLFEDLDREPPEALGPEPRRQIAILRQFIKRRD